MKHLKSLFLLAFIAAAGVSSGFAQATGSISGQVEDSFGAVVTGATVIAVNPDGAEKSTTTNGQGVFTISGLTPGNYIVRVIAEGFAFFENSEVVVAPGSKQSLTLALTVEGVEEKVEVGTPGQVSTDADSNLSATVISGQDLDALPDDPDELEAALQALAGPGSGPNGGQIYIDGFTGGQLPPKESIREIRINSNPFSPEYDRLGFGRIEILTKPGSDKFRGSAFFNFNDESLNSRNPFAVNRAPSQTRFYGAQFSGPVQKGKSSYSIDFSNREIDSGSLLNAQIIDSGFNVVPFQEEFTIPTRRFQIAPRFDYQINDTNTLVLRYSYSRFSADNQGIGDTSLPTRAYSTLSSNHEFRLTETMIINSRTVNETRFEYRNNNRETTGDNSIPTINVSSAFTGGGAQIGLNYNRENSIEFQNNTTTTFGKNSQHAVKFGVRVRSNWLEDRSESNYGGTFTFAGAAAVIDTANPACQVPDPPASCILAPAVSPIEQYRQKLLGNTDPRFNPNQFTITSGNPLADVSQTDVSLFAGDDWRVNPGLTLSAGMRYEIQTNVSDNFNFAPRFGFAYSPGAGGARAPKTVFRGGFGVFYERISDSLTLNSRRFDGQQQFSYIVSNNSAGNIALLSQPIFTLGGVTNVPSISQLSPLSNTIRLLAPNIQSPYTLQTVLSVERQLPAKVTLSVSYIGARTLHQLRARNINAPVCPDFQNCNSSLRPDPTSGNIYQYESSGISNSNRFNLNFRSFLNQNFSIFGNYSYGFTNSDADGSGSFPAYSYDLEGEYGRASSDIRHFFIMGGSIGVPWGIRLNPFIIANTGRPFNITTGFDSNGDGIFNERPTYSQIVTRCAELGLTSSFCSPNGVSDLDSTIPRNYGESPSSFTVNLRINKSFGFGSTERSGGSAEGDRPRGGGIPGVGRGGRGGGGRGGFGGSDGPSKYNLNVGLNFNNLFNTVNLGTPVGNLNSSRFGQSVSTGGGFGGFRGSGGSDGGNRRVELQLRFSF